MSDQDTPAGPDEATHQVTVFAAVGGQQFFDHLVERFYAHVADDPVLLQLYPEQHDLGPARERLALFLGQYLEFAAQGVEQAGQREGLALGLHAAAFEAGNIQQVADQVFGRTQ